MVLFESELFADRGSFCVTVYNIIMDFIFAIFPWILTWKLKLKKSEKIALCATLSLGIIVAVITAVRTWWKDTPLMHVHDRWYICKLPYSKPPFPPPPPKKTLFFVLSILTHTPQTRARRHVPNLVLRRSRRHHHRAMHPGAAALHQRPAHLPHLAQTRNDSTHARRVQLARQHAGRHQEAISVFDVQGRGMWRRWRRRQATGPVRANGDSRGGLVEFVDADTRCAYENGSQCGGVLFAAGVGGADGRVGRSEAGEAGELAVVSDAEREFL